MLSKRAGAGAKRKPGKARTTFIGYIRRAQMQQSEKAYRLSAYGGVARIEETELKRANE